MAKKSKKSLKNLDILSLVIIGLGLLTFLFYAFSFMTYYFNQSLYITEITSSYSMNGYQIAFGANDISVITKIAGSDPSTSLLEIKGVQLLEIALFISLIGCAIAGIRFIVNKKIAKFVSLAAAVVFVGASVLMFIALPNSYFVINEIVEDSQQYYSVNWPVYIAASVNLVAGGLSVLKFLSK